MEGNAASEVALKVLCSLGAGYVAVPLPHGGDSVC